ncbi:MAG: hypothetical protein ACKO6A_01445 [Bacteroidota bacterium]
MKKNLTLSSLLVGLLISSSCEESPSTDWKENDNAAEKQLQIMCEGFKESDNWDCDCFKKVTKEMYPDLKEFYKIRGEESKYSKENDAWYSKLDEKCKQKEASGNSK